MVSKLNQREVESDPKITKAQAKSVPSTFPATMGWPGIVANCMANEHTAMSAMGFTGTALREITSPAWGRSATGSVTNERCAQPRDTTGSTQENTAIHAGLSPMNTQQISSPTKMDAAWYTATRMGLSAPKNSHHSKMRSARPPPVRTRPIYLSVVKPAAAGTPTAAGIKHAATSRIEPSVIDAPVTARQARLLHIGTMRRARSATTSETTPMHVSKST